MSAALTSDKAVHGPIVGPRPTLRPQSEGPEALAGPAPTSTRWHWVLAAAVLLSVGAYAVWKISTLGPAGDSIVSVNGLPADSVNIDQASDESSGMMVSPARPLQRTPTSAELAGSAKVQATMPAGKPARYMTVDKRRVRVYDRPQANVEVPCRITSEPSGARVMWKGTHLGNTPLQVNLPEGPQPLVLALSGFTQRELNLPVYFGENGEPVERYIHLRP